VPPRRCRMDHAGAAPRRVLAPAPLVRHSRVTIHDRAGPQAVLVSRLRPPRTIQQRPARVPRRRHLRHGGGNPEHAALAARTIRALGAQLADKPCEVFTSDLRVRVAATGLATYPDVTVVCGPLETDPEDPATVTNRPSSSRSSATPPQTTIAAKSSTTTAASRRCTRSCSSRTTPPPSRSGAAPRPEPGRTRPPRPDRPSGSHPSAASSPSTRSTGTSRAGRRLLHRTEPNCRCARFTGRLVSARAFMPAAGASICSTSGSGHRAKPPPGPSLGDCR